MQVHHNGMTIRIVPTAERRARRARLWGPAPRAKERWPEPPAKAAPTPAPPPTIAPPMLAAPESPAGAVRPVRLVQQVVAELTGIPRPELLSPKRTHPVAHARQAAMWLARQSGASFKEIGRRFGGKDHTTVVYAVRKIDMLLAAATRALPHDRELAGLVARAAKELCARGFRVELPTVAAPVRWRAIAREQCRNLFEDNEDDDAMTNTDAAGFIRLLATWFAEYAALDEEIASRAQANGDARLRDLKLVSASAWDAASYKATELAEIVKRGALDHCGGRP